MSADPCAYDLMTWIFSSFPCRLRLVPAGSQIPEMQTQYQFAIVGMLEQKNWDKLVATNRKGTFFAWHGSKAHSWHAILRQGLRNLSM